MARMDLGRFNLFFLMTENDLINNAINKCRFQAEN